MLPTPSGSPARPAAVADDALLGRAREGDRAALGRLITRVERGAAELDALIALIHGSPPRARTLGITGPPGAGKSTFIGALLGPLLSAGQRVAVVAVDPTSPVTRGAVLGDRVRMAGTGDRSRLFIRSLAARGELGGLSGTTGLIVDLLDTCGFDTVIVETVGVGQSEVAIAALAQSTLLVLAPNLGDDVQSLKAGILEIADLLVVNKCDLPGAGQLASWLKAMPPAAGRAERSEVVRCSATDGTGIDAVLAAIDRLANEDSARHTRLARLSALVRNRVMARVAERLDEPDDALEDDVKSIAAGRLALDTAVEAVLSRINRNQ